MLGTSINQAIKIIKIAINLWKKFFDIILNNYSKIKRLVKATSNLPLSQTRLLSYLYYLENNF